MTRRTRLLLVVIALGLMVIGTGGLLLSDSSGRGAAGLLIPFGVVFAIAMVALVLVIRSRRL